MGDDKGKARKKQAPVDVDKLRREAKQQQRAARVGNLLRQLAVAADHADRLGDLADEVIAWVMGEPQPAQLDTSWGLGAVMAALARELGSLRQSAGDEGFADLVADLRADLPEMWQAAHPAGPAEPVKE